MAAVTAISPSYEESIPNVTTIWQDWKLEMDSTSKDEGRVCDCLCCRLCHRHRQRLCLCARRRSTRKTHNWQNLADGEDSIMGAKPTDNNDFPGQGSGGPSRNDDDDAAPRPYKRNSTKDGPSTGVVVTAIGLPLILLLGLIGYCYCYCASTRKQTMKEPMGEFTSEPEATGDYNSNSNSNPTPGTENFSIEDTEEKKILWKRISHPCHQILPSLRLEIFPTIL